MTDRIGYVVLARRPNPYKEHPWDYETVGPVYAVLERLRDAMATFPDDFRKQDNLEVEYVVGEVSAMSTEKPPWPEITERTP